jgi:hypothetical protein
VTSFESPITGGVSSTAISGGWPSKRKNKITATGSTIATTRIIRSHSLTFFFWVLNGYRPLSHFGSNF